MTDLTTIPQDDEGLLAHELRHAGFDDGSATIVDRSNIAGVQTIVYDRDPRIAGGREFHERRVAVYKPNGECITSSIVESKVIDPATGKRLS